MRGHRVTNQAGFDIHYAMQLSRAVCDGQTLHLYFKGQGKEGGGSC